MDADRHSRIERLFLATLEQGEESRTAFLEEMCAGDEGLHHEVYSLLAAYAQPPDYLRDNWSAGIPELFSGHESAGDTIGPYRLEEQIGEGGFGTVWRAMQEHPIKREVALKIIKLGMDTKEVVARFQQERQALAMMDHASIAKVLDAGATATGRPYFAMELIHGRRITEFCDERALTVSERLKLFIKVCEAVQHAHQKGIIHRDIKPSNVLVALHGNEAVPKVIDFGVAKAIQQQRLIEQTLHTRSDQLIGTPLYMSPEQLEMRGGDLDTRTDIYSLGALLYELLTGRTPFEPSCLTSLGLDEIRKLIREVEPALPSTSLGSLTGEARTTFAARRQADPLKLTRNFRGDLDAIVMQALEKERNRRYATADAFAQDVQRFLSNEPVSARRATAWQKLRKSIRRNKVAFTASAAVLIAVFVGLGFSTWMYLRERHARERAAAAERLELVQRQAAERDAKSNRVLARIVTRLFNAIDPLKAKGRDTSIVTEFLYRTADRVEEEYGEDDSVALFVMQSMAKGFRGIGDYKKALEIHRKILKICRRDGEDGVEAAGALNAIAMDLQELGRLSEAEDHYLQALGVEKRLRDVNASRREAAVLYNLAQLLIRQERREEATDKLQQAQIIFRRLGILEMEGGIANALGTVKMQSGDYQAAEHYFRDSIHLSKAAPESINVLNAKGNLASSLSSQGKHLEAKELSAEVVAITKRIYGPSHPQTASTLMDHATRLWRANAKPEALSLRAEAIELLRATKGPLHPETLMCVADFADDLVSAGRSAEAEGMLKEEINKARGQPNVDPSSFAYMLMFYGGITRRMGSLHEAELALREAIETLEAHVAQDDGYLMRCRSGLARVLADQAIQAAERKSPNAMDSKRSIDPSDLAAESECLSQVVLEDYLRKFPNSSGTIGDAQSRVGWSLLARAQTDTSISHQERAILLRDAETKLRAGTEAVLQDKEWNAHREDSINRMIKVYSILGSERERAKWEKELQRIEPE